jgi:hypothetical protein
MSHCGLGLVFVMCQSTLNLLNGLYGYEQRQNLTTTSGGLYSIISWMLYILGRKKIKEPLLSTSRFAFSFSVDIHSPTHSYRIYPATRKHHQHISKQKELQR